MPFIDFSVPEKCWVLVVASTESKVIRLDSTGVQIAASCRLNDKIQHVTPRDKPALNTF